VERDSGVNMQAFNTGNKPNQNDPTAS